jgi:hypothetical protein
MANREEGSKADMHSGHLMVGLDVGSTTVKAVVIDPATDKILWSDYQRHDTKQPEKCLEFLKRIEGDFSVPHEKIRIFITGSGGGGVANLIGAKFVQEVNAVALAVEKLYSNCGSVIELGGQDAKIIIFKEDPETGRKKKNPFHERQVCGRHRRRHRQDQCETSHPGRGTLQYGLLRTEAAPGRRKMRSLCRNRYQRIAEERRAPAGADGVAV